MIIYDMMNTFHQGLRDIESTPYDLVKLMIKVHNDREIEKQVERAKAQASGVQR